MQELNIDQVSYVEDRINSTFLFPIVITLHSLYYMESFKFKNWNVEQIIIFFQVCFSNMVSQANNR